MNENSSENYEDDQNCKNWYYRSVTGESLDLDITPLPNYLKNISPNRDLEIAPTDHGNKDRGNWDTQFEHLLSCIGYIIGLGNVWSFPIRVYEGGGIVFFGPYLCFCALVGGPMIILEMSLGQFRGKGCIKAFEFCPAFSGIGYTVLFISVLILINNIVTLTWCLLYFLFSFQPLLIWSVCSNSFNNEKCINSSSNNGTFNNGSYETSAFQFWNIYVTGEVRQDNTTVKLIDSFEHLNIPCTICMILFICILGFSVAFGVNIIGKIMYVTVLFPYIAVLQFIILGCTLPGAISGIKFFLHPNFSKLRDPNTYLKALEQTIYFSGIATGGFITVSSFNRFRDKIHRNAIIVLSIKIFTNFIFVFVTFSMLGYVSSRTGKKLSDLLRSDSNLLFITYSEALTTIASSNLWTILLMFMALCLGFDNVIILLETIFFAISDYFPKLYSQRNRSFLILTICFFLFNFCIIFNTPNGLNWFILFEKSIIPLVLTLLIILEILSLCGIYGVSNFLYDVMLMTGPTFNYLLIFALCVFIPVSAVFLLIMLIKNAKLISIHGIAFPEWTQILIFIVVIIILSPIIGKAIYVLIKTKSKNKNIGLIKYLKINFTAPPDWGPRLKRYWIQSFLYSRKLINYQDDPILLASLDENEEIEKLVAKSQLTIQKFQIKIEQNDLKQIYFSPLK